MNIETLHETPRAAETAHSKLDQLKSMTKVVADTGDIDAIKKYQPVDCTTNPSLVLKAMELSTYEHIFKDAIAWGKSQPGKREAVVKEVASRLPIEIGAELARIVPGRVSTEVDADLSFDVKGSIGRAHEIIAAYKERGVDKEKILIKLASTWEGVEGREPPREGGHPLQSDAAVLAASGGRLLQSGRDARLAFRRPHLRLVREA